MKQTFDRITRKIIALFLWKLDVVCGLVFKGSLMNSQCQAWLRGRLPGPVCGGPPPRISGAISLRYG